MRYSNDMFHHMFKAEFVTLVSLKVPSGSYYYCSTFRCDPRVVALSSMAENYLTVVGGAPKKKKEEVGGGEAEAFKKFSFPSLMERESALLCGAQKSPWFFAF